MIASLYFCWPIACRRLRPCTTSMQYQISKEKFAAFAAERFKIDLVDQYIKITTRKSPKCGLKKVS